MTIYPVIMCGGAGSRLWPASRSARPKQFIALAAERSTFQDAVLRVQDLSEARTVLVVAGIAHEAALREQLAAIGARAELILEPEPRDSAPAMAAACAWIAARDPQGVACVVSADHHIPDAIAFREAVLTAARGAEEGRIVTLGVAPHEPSTAYGYIAPGAPEGAVRRIEAFVEKPDVLTAQRYIRAGYLWNSGNFVVRADHLLAELDRFAPGVSAAARRALAEAREDGRLGEAFLESPRISIDYAVMEKTDSAAVLPVGFAWSDLGAWDAVWAVSEKDAQGNASRGEAYFLGASDCLVRAPSGLQVTVVGARNLAIVADAGQVLVCDMAHSQAVKTAVDQLKTDGREATPRPAAWETLGQARQEMGRWLRVSALPVWWSLGADHASGGFHEALDLEGRPLAAARRARVQTRQAYVYANAGRIGWTGPWRQAAWWAMGFFLDRYTRPDGLFRTLVGPDGAILDDTPWLYDQAFALLAMASLRQAGPCERDLEAIALQVLDGLEGLAHPAGGYREAGPQPFQANAHMHLFEAALAWIEAGGGARFEALAERIATLCLERFIDPQGGFLREFFDADWRPAPGKEGRIVEPGHQFEWAWLLERWSRRGRPDVLVPARRLYAAGLRGVLGQGVAINVLEDGALPLDCSARLWPQTEYLKAALRLGGADEALSAANALRRYLDTPVPGLWRDKLSPDGTFLEEPAPASSFYHIMCAALELLDA